MRFFAKIGAAVGAIAGLTDATALANSSSVSAGRPALMIAVVSIGVFTAICYAAGWFADRAITHIRAGGIVGRSIATGTAAGAMIGFAITAVSAITCAALSVDVTAGLNKLPAALGLCALGGCGVGWVAGLVVTRKVL